MLQGIKSEVFFTHRRETINAKSVVGILMLAAKQNSQITICVEGEDADTVMEKLVTAFRAGFEE
jgi:phosphocarrier protein